MIAMLFQIYFCFHSELAYVFQPYTVEMKSSSMVGGYHVISHERIIVWITTPPSLKGAP